MWMAKHRHVRGGGGILVLNEWHKTTMGISFNPKTSTDPQFWPSALPPMNFHQMLTQILLIAVFLPFFLQNSDCNLCLPSVASMLNAKQRNLILEKQTRWTRMGRQEIGKDLKKHPKQPDFLFLYYKINGNPTRIFRRNPFCSFSLLPKHYCHEK
uniref:Uncharacterized protein n=1 Tax=Globodera rostochiensis TaxID=31243 RepID=A0A914IDE7_GLORO